MSLPLRLLSMVVAVAFCQHTSAGELKPKELKEARKIYVAKCAKCHRFYEPKNYSQADWQTWMEKMSRKAKLKTNQEALLSQYLDEYRAGRIQTAK